EHPPVRARRRPRAARRRGSRAAVEEVCQSSGSLRGSASSLWRAGPPGLSIVHFQEPMPTRTTVEITMPQMGESVTEGTILEWRKQVGDPVDQDEALVDVSTDKVDTEVPSPAAGTLT